MANDFQTITWDENLVADCRALVRLALSEDTDRTGDLTTAALVETSRRGAACVVAREQGVLAGAGVAPIVLEEAGADARWTASLDDGAPLRPGVRIGRLEGAARDLLSCERVILNLMSRLCGVASLTRRFVDRIAGTGAAVYDTRKTTPGWRRLEKYAVARGGGRNHRLGLSDAILIKDNHLALAAENNLSPADAVRLARAAEDSAGREHTVIEIEVDTLDQLRDALASQPDIVLLDNMAPDQLEQAVKLRDASQPGAVLEASGGVRLESIEAIAASGVDRISVGALTHAATGLDIGLDWDQEETT